MKPDLIDIIAKYSISEQEKLLAHYVARNDTAMADGVREAMQRKGSVQTEELSNCGKLIWKRNFDADTGRITHTATGDNLSWMRHFMSQGAIGRFDTASFTGANSQAAKELRASQVTLTLAPGENAQVVKVG